MTRARPFAIYYAYHDKAQKISEESQHYKCYYPFLDYSPELTALREAHKIQTDVSFIDLSYGDILAASAEKLTQGEAPRNYNDDYLLARNDYIDRLCEKTGLRSFDEFWENILRSTASMRIVRSGFPISIHTVRWRGKIRPRKPCSARGVWRGNSTWRRASPCRYSRANRNAFLS